MLHKTAFSMDTGLSPEPILQAYSTGETWNGFGCPIATRGQLIAYTEQIRKSPLNNTDYCKDGFMWSVDSHGVLHIPDDEGYMDFEPQFNEELNDNMYILGGWLCWWEQYEMSDHVRAICSELNELGYSTDVLTDQRLERGVVGRADNKELDSTTDAGNLPKWIMDNYIIKHEDNSIFVIEK